jgi:sodium-coupled monocarboxylate transporter 8/12
VIGGPLLGLFILAIFVPFANSKGAIIGTLSSMSFTIWIFLGSAINGIKVYQN